MAQRTSQRRAVWFAVLSLSAVGSLLAQLFGSVTPRGSPSAGPEVTRRHLSDSASRPLPPGAIRFAAIGDQMRNTADELDVSSLIKRRAVDFAITLGDNNLDQSLVESIGQNVWQYQPEFISPYVGGYGSGAATNLFFPTLGNHDWLVPALPCSPIWIRALPVSLCLGTGVTMPWLGALHLYALSVSHDLYGIVSTSVQAEWLRTTLAVSHSSCNVACLHHASYSSGMHGDTPAVRWPYREWGASVVLAGHDHGYERIVQDGIRTLWMASAGSASGGRGRRSFPTASSAIPTTLARCS